jgi:hypothetical protein
MKLRLVFLLAAFSRKPLRTFELWRSEQFRREVNKAAGIEQHIHLDGAELSDAFRAYFRQRDLECWDAVNKLNDGEAS